MNPSKKRCSSTLASDNDECEMEEEAEEEAVYEETISSLGIKSADEEAQGNAPGKMKVNYHYSAQGKSLTSTAALGELPAVLLERIFLYSTEKPCDVLPLERVCKAMHFVLRDGSTFWDQHVNFKLSSPYIIGNCHEENHYGKWDLDPRLSASLCSSISERQLSTREAAFWKGGLRLVLHTRCYHYREYDTKNLILSALENSADTFRSVLVTILAKMKKPGTPCNGIPRLRGDTVGYLADLTQAWAVARLESALLTAFNGGRVAVTKEDITHLDRMRSSSIFLRPLPTLNCSVGMKQHHSTSLDFCSCFCPSSGETKWHWPEDDCLGDDVLSAELRFKMVRFIAYRAGIVKISSAALDLIAAEIFHLLGVLMVDGFEASKATDYEALIHKTSCRRLTYGTPGDGIDMFSVPPPPVPVEDEANGYIYTIVPGQIKAAADKRMRGKSVNGIVFGEIWIPSSGLNAGEEKRGEMSRYFPDEVTSGVNLDGSAMYLGTSEGTAAGDEDMDYEYESESDDETELDEEVWATDKWIQEELERLYDEYGRWTYDRRLLR